MLIVIQIIPTVSWVCETFRHSIYLNIYITQIHYRQLLHDEAIHQRQEACNINMKNNNNLTLTNHPPDGYKQFCLLQILCLLSPKLQLKVPVISSQEENQRYQ